MFLKILSIIFLIPGFTTVFTAKQIVNRFELNEKAHCKFENDLSEEELREYKYNKALVQVKMVGMLIALPGLALILIAFR